MATSKKPGWGDVLRYHWKDHGYLRLLWTNLVEIAPGVWRSNQPDPARMRRYHRMGIRDIVIVRGKRSRAAFELEMQVAKELGIRIHHIPLKARAATPPEQMLAFLETARRLPKPWLFHCKSGADRAGLAAALYVLSETGSLEAARRQLSWRYTHLKSTKTGIIDVFFDQYEEARDTTGIGIEDWIRTEYKPEQLTREFEQGRRHGKRWERD